MQIRMNITMDETKLIERCIQKDPLAWSEFVNRYSRLIYWTIKTRLKRWNYLFQLEDVDEIHQNVFLALWKKNKLQQVKDRRKIEAWIITISANETVDYFRHKKGQMPPNTVSIFEKITQKKGTVSIADLIPSQGPNPVHAADARNIHSLLERWIDCLSPKEKIIIKLNLLYGKRYREIAKILNMPIGTVASLIKRSKSNLKKRLKAKGINS